MRPAARLLGLSLVAAACGSSKAKDPCAGVAGTCLAFTPDQSEATIQNAIAGAKDGTTLAFAEGTFSFTNEITLAAKGLTLQGAGREVTTLDFHGQLAGSEGVLVSGSSFTMVDLGVKDPLGNGVKIVGATGVTLRRVKAFYTNPDKSKHGGYAIYPVQCHQVLVEGSYASGATDTGIYVGQSEQVVLWNNEATQNVAGLEIENTHFADVHDNDAHDNSAGILVFALPRLMQKDTHDVRVFANRAVNNNVPNFAPAGGIIGNVRAAQGCS